MIETYPLVWPEGWPRTLLKDRAERKAWKKTERQAISDLEMELKRFGMLSATLTRKDPSDFRGADDPSVAVYFSRRREDDFSWQAALGISNPSPTVDEIELAFRTLARKYHTDVPGSGDLELFLALSKHKEKAIAFARRLSGAAHDLAIACDKYKEVKWNIFAVSNTIYSLRQMERDGSSSLLERALSGYAVLPESIGDARHVHATSAQ